MHNTVVSFTFHVLATIVVCEGRMNVLFIVADDVRPELGSFYGPDFPSPIHPKMHTPNLDSLSSKSLLLKRTYVQQALCAPSRVAMLTSRRPDTTHVYDNKHYFRKVGGNFTTLPQYFKDNGYRSVGMGKIFHEGHKSHINDPESWSEKFYTADGKFGGRDHSWLAVPNDKVQFLTDRNITDYAISTLQRVAPMARNNKQQFFMAVGLAKPNIPYMFPTAVMEKYYPENSIRLPPNPYAPYKMPPIAWHGYGELRRYKDISALNVTGHINTTLPDKVVLELRRAYYSALTWVDSLIGEILNALDVLGLSNNTIVSFWSDHGVQLGEHGEWSKMTNFELATHVPMLIHVPGLTDAGVTTEQLAESVDLFPTIVEAAGLDPLPLCPIESVNVDLCREGMSLVPLIRHPNDTVKRAAFSQYPRDGHIMGYSIRTNMYRYTEWVNFSYAPLFKPDWNHLTGRELYDHAKDPEENYNRADDSNYRSVVVGLRKQLHDGWRKALVL